MTTADRIEQVGYRTWAPVGAAADEDYVGRHRRLDVVGRAVKRSFSLTRVFYSARHRRVGGR